MSPSTDHRGLRPAFRTLTAISLVLSLACGKAAAPPPPPDGVWDRGIAPLVTIEGKVTDVETGQPVAGAEVRVVGGPTTTTGSDGRFVLQTEPGRRQIELRANGFLLARREVAAGETQFQSSIQVARSGPSQPIGAAGGALSQGDTSLEIPPGAFPDGATVALTALPRGQAAVVAAPVQFVDDDGVPRRVVGVVVLEASLDPAVALEVKTPVPQDATTDTVVLHKIDGSGAWSTPVAPRAITDGVATFPVAASGRYGVSMDAGRSDGARIGYVVTDDGDGATSAGSVLSGGAPIQTGQEPLTVVDPRGATIEIGPASQVVLQEPNAGNRPIGVPDAGAPPGDAGAEDGLAPYAGRITVTAGRGRVTVVRPGAVARAALAGAALIPPAALLVTVNSQLILVRDGAFALQACNNGGRSITDLQVVQGSVEVRTEGETLTIPAGQGRAFCPGCTGDEAPVCTGESQAVPRPRLEVTPLVRAYEEREVDSASPPATFTFKNLGGAPTGKMGIRFEGVIDGSFESTADTCSNEVLAPGSACTVQVVFRPKRAGLAEISLTGIGQAGASATAQLAGRGRAQTRLRLSSESLSFSDQQVGTTGTARPLTLTNEGSAAAGPLAIELGGSDPGSFRITSSTCASKLAPGASCNLAVAFAPAAAGAAAAQLQASDGRRMVTAALSGKGLAPARLVASPPRLAFPDQASGTTSAAETVTFSNPGDVPTGALQVVLGGSATHFVLDAAGCSLRILPPKGTCTVTVAFRPTASGQALATVDATAAPGGTASVGLGGRAAAPARLAVSPPLLSFPDQLTGTAGEERALTFTNQGESATPPLAVTLAGTGAAHFVLNAGDCLDRELPAGGACTVRVTFHPGARGPAAAAVRVTAAGGVAAAAALEGLALAAAQLTVSTPSIRFPSRVRDTTSPPRSFTIVNSGDVASGPLSVGLSGPGAAAFALDATGCAGVSVPPHTSCTVRATFRPTARGEATATVQVSGSPGGSPSVGLAGQGLSPAHLRLSRAQVAFGDRVVGTTSTVQTVIFTNDGDVATGPLGPVLSGAGAAQFLADGAACTGVTLSPGTSCAVKISFRPVVAGPALASVGLTGGPEDAGAVALTGQGLLPARLVITGPTDFAEQATGARGDPETFTVTNPGDVPAGPLGLQLTSDPAGSFALEAGACAGATLAPRAACTLAVSFQPTRIGEASGVLTVTGAPSAPATTRLTGEGLTPARLTAAPLGLAFADQIRGTQSEPRSLTFTNEGAVATAALAVALGGTTPGQFQIVTDTCTGVAVDPGASCAVGVAFAPTAGGAASGTVLVTGAPGGSDTPALTGKGLTPAALAVSPATTAFGGQVRGSSSEGRAITFSNAGDFPTGPLSAAVLDGAAPGQFAILADGCALAVLQPAGSCTVTVAFRPTALGAQEAGLGLGATPGGSAPALLGGHGLAPVDLTTSQDVGPVTLPGRWTLAGGTHTLRAAGADIGGTADAFHFAYRAVTGDVTITARVTSLLDTSALAKAGVMIREGLTAGARNVATLVTPTVWNLFRQQARDTTGGSTVESTSAEPSALPAWLRLQRTGSTFTSFYSLDGTTWTRIGAPVTVSMGAAVFVGLATTSHNPAGHTTATLTDVTVGGSTGP